MGQGSITLDADVIKTRHISDLQLTRGKSALRALDVIPINLADLRVWDARATNLPTAAASDDLGYVTGTLGTNPPQVQAGDLKAAGATTRRAGAVIELPGDYADGNTVTIRLTAGMKTTVSDTSATIDVEAYQLLDDGTISADLCTTAAQSINSLTYAAKSFTITPSTLVAGSRLDVRISIAVNDGATATAVIALVHRLDLLCDRQP